MLPFQQQVAVAVIHEDFIGFLAGLTEEGLQGVRAVQVRQRKPEHAEQVFHHGSVFLPDGFHVLLFGHHQIQYIDVTEQRFPIVTLLELAPAQHVMSVDQERGVVPSGRVGVDHRTERLLSLGVTAITEQQVTAPELGLDPELRIRMLVHQRRQCGKVLIAHAA